MYFYINNLLRVINDQRYKPTIAQLKAIKSILEQFEKEHCSDRTSKGKLLIKDEYIKTELNYNSVFVISISHLGFSLSISILQPSRLATIV